VQRLATPGSATSHRRRLPRSPQRPPIETGLYFDGAYCGVLLLFICALQACLAACSDMLGFYVRACAMQVFSCDRISPLVVPCDDGELPSGACELVEAD
jgi:hypothetical protein